MSNSTDSTQMTLAAPCPTCDTRIRFHGVPILGDALYCPECGTKLEIVSLRPIKLDWTPDAWYEFNEDDY